MPDYNSSPYSIVRSTFKWITTVPLAGTRRAFMNRFKIILAGIHYQVLVYSTIIKHHHNYKSKNVKTSYINCTKPIGSKLLYHVPDKIRFSLFSDEN
ncbi:hypothetical protein QTP88_011935 [Uroleucon formosanum]